MQIIFLLVIAWAVARGFDNARTSVRTRTAAARAKTPDAHKRRAARQAATGWWAGEILHGFPTIRHGTAAGWADHRDAWTAHRVATTKRRAESAEKHLGWQAEIAAYLHRLELAAAKRTAGPSMSEQLTAAVRGMRKRLDPEQGTPGPDPDPDPEWERCLDPENEDPPEWVRKRQDSREAPMPAPAPGCTDLGCTCHKGDQPQPEGAAPVTTPSGAGGGADTTYTETNTLCDELIAAAEQAIDGAKITQAQALADGVGAMMRGDAKMAELAVQTAQDAANIKRSADQLQEHAAAMKEYNTKNYGPQVEAVASSEAGVAAQPGYVEGQ